MRACQVARQRRDMSVDHYQTALQSALQAIPGMCGYYWRHIFTNRGLPSVIIIVQLGRGYEAVDAAEASVAVLKRDLAVMFLDMDNMFVVVTHCSRSFRSLRATAVRALPLYSMLCPFFVYYEKCIRAV
jgi:hypothetical protein